MEIIKNLQITGAHHRPILLDIYFEKNKFPKSVIIFSHGFKGFKDWGPFDLIAEKFARAGFIFVKFNFSHNGTSPEHTDEFVDVEAFGQNNLMIELEDLQSVIDFIFDPSSLELFSLSAENCDLFLIGHSRGGGITILKGANDPRVKKMATLASVNRFGTFFDKEKVKQWKEDGVMWIENTRTKQQLPMYYEYYEVLMANRGRLNIHEAITNLSKPLLIIHGSDDESVSYSQAAEMHQWNPAKTELLTIQGANHTFGGRHPWTEKELPPDFLSAINKMITFFQS